MKITKFVHSCLLVETPDRTAIFDPGVYSAEALGQALPSLDRLDDIFITHEHADHFDIETVKRLVQKFPKARITSTGPVVDALAKEGITASTAPPEGASFFDSPHENVQPLFQQPANIGIHYLDQLTDPGDSHSFQATKAVLALPMTAPWGGSIRAATVALKLKPQHVLPIHDWHWSDAARQQAYDLFDQSLARQGIKFHKLETGQPVEIDL